ncbi:hypothetical protein XENOCAPTIV_014908, partial [Xenoophorus captivus]
VLVAAFAVSGYSSTYYRAGSKPFNPLLGETYECIREDKGFCFFSEQVSHHPPISTCHCESKNFTFWQGKECCCEFNRFLLISCHCFFLGLEIIMSGIKSPPVYTTSSVDDGGSNITARSPSET